MSLFDRNGTYEGNIVVSMQSSKSNTAINTVLKKPNFKKSATGTYITAKDDVACISSVDVKDAVIIDSRRNHKTCRITYNNTDVIFTVVFLAG